MDKMLKVKDVSEILGCGINKAYDIVNSQGFPKMIIGKRIYIHPEKFNEWIKAYTYKEYKL